MIRMMVLLVMNLELAYSLCHLYNCLSRILHQLFRILRCEVCRFVNSFFVCFFSFFSSVSCFVSFILFVLFLFHLIILFYLFICFIFYFFGGGEEPLQF